MDGTPRTIEIFAPFSAAIERTKLLLFQPFDIAKWLVIGFAAFLAQLGGGAGTNFFNYGRGIPGHSDWSFRSTSRDVMDSASGMPSWVLPLIGVALLLLIAIGIALLWVGSRGRFIFTDCIVRNRAAIVEPWHEYRKEGNSLFVFSLIVGLGMLLVLGIAGVPLWLPLLMRGEAASGVGLVFAVGLFAVVAALLLVAWTVISKFMIPVMYRRRCGAMEGFQGALALVIAEPGPVMLYVLFSIVLAIGLGTIACVLTCVTCCITAIPYVGTVVLLPIHVLLMSYLLLFVRQFGPDYDAWANLAAAPVDAPAMIAPPPPPPEAEPPPFQT